MTTYTYDLDTGGPIVLPNDSTPQHVKLSGLGAAIDADRRNSLTVFDFGAKGNGIADDHAAFQAAAASGRRVYVPKVSTFYAISSYLDFSNGTELVGIGKPTIKATSDARMIRANTVSNILIEGITFNANKDVTIGGNVGTIQNTCVNVVIRDCVFVNTKAHLAFTSGSKQCKVEGSQFLSTGGGILLMDANENEILFNSFQSDTSFGILLDGSSSYNLVQGNRCKQNSLELIGLTTNCEYNRIIANYAEGTGDNGISISGRRNIVNANVCRGNAFNGISFFGDENSGDGNICWNNGQAGGGVQYSGIRIHGGFGWRGYRNSITNTSAGDSQVTPTQKWGVRVNGTEYVQWVSGGAISGANLWRFNGIHIYKAASAGGGVCGTTAPTHTTGTVSDGLIQWVYFASFDINTAPRYNHVSGTRGTGNTQGLEEVVFPNGHFSNTKLKLGWDGSGVAQEIQAEIHLSNGTPEGAITAAPGAMALRGTGAAFGLSAYFKYTGSGNTGWAPVHLRSSGATASRPTGLVAGERGVMFYDSTLNKPVFWDGSAWRDADGNVA